MDTSIIVAGLGLVFWGLTMLAIVNVILKDFGSIQYKAMWGLIALIPFVGWSIILYSGKKRSEKRVKVTSHSTNQFHNNTISGICWLSGHRIIN